MSPCLRIFGFCLIVVDYSSHKISLNVLTLEFTPRFIVILTTTKLLIGNNAMFKIGQLAKLTGVTQDTLRYYEKMQLLEVASRTQAGYRLYATDSPSRLQFIKQAKSVGFTLQGIKELLSLKVDKASHSCADVKQLTEQKLLEIEEKINELILIKQALNKLNDACCGGQESAEHCSILHALESGKAPEREWLC